MRMARKFPPGDGVVAVFVSRGDETVSLATVAGRILLFPIDEIISYVSWVFTLEPGDVIATGTPAGVGESRTPPRFLRSGDVVQCTIEGIGTLSNEFVQ